MHHLLLGALATSLVRMLPALAGPKRCGKRGIGLMIQDLRAGIPDNGVGPEIEFRKQAVRFLECNCRMCGQCKIGVRLRRAA